MPPSGSKPDRRKTDRTSAALKAQIDENLKRVYDAALTEEVPDRFKDLLAQLRAKGEAQ